MQHPDHRPAPTASKLEPVTTRDIALSAALWRIAAAAVVSGATLVAAPPAFGQTSRYDAAHVDYEIGHYEHAFAIFASLADEGHCGASRVAQEMVRYGRPLYAIDFKVAPERLERWQRLPACPVAVAGGNAERRAP